MYIIIGTCHRLYSDVSGFYMKQLIEYDGTANS